jgi:hypothetical protein
MRMTPRVESSLVDASARRHEGFQEVLSDEVADEARGFAEDQPAGQRSEGFRYGKGTMHEILIQF